MRFLLCATLSASLLLGCASNSSRVPDFDSSGNGESRSHGGKVIGGAGGAAVGGAVGYSSAGILCTIGGPLCMAFVIPAAIVGGLVGLAAGSLADAVKDARAEPAGPATDEAAPPRADTSPRPGG